MKTHKRPFDIYLPASKDTPPKHVETIEVDVYENFGNEFLTAKSRELIDRVTARHMGVMTGEEIKQLRLRLGRTQSEFAKLIQCGEKSLPRWESGRCQPSGIVNVVLRLLDEGFLAPASLMAVQGPKKERRQDFLSYQGGQKKKESNPYVLAFGSNFSVEGDEDSDLATLKAA